MDEGIVYIVDDDEAVRNSLDALIRSVGLPTRTYSTAHGFLDQYQSDQRGCLVLDIRMPGMSGLELQRALKEKNLDIPIIFMTGHGDLPIAVRAMKDGALEFLEKPFSKQLLLEHVRDALKVDAERRERSVQKSSLASRMASLTQRERQVMHLVAAGRLSKQIAMELGISKKTVDVHRARVMRKLEVDSLPALVELSIAARQSGLDS